MLAQAAARFSGRWGPTAALGPRHACGAGAHNQYLAALGPVMPAALGPLHACVAGDPKTHPSPTPNAIITMPAAASQAPCVMYTPRDMNMAGRSACMLVGTLACMLAGTVCLYACWHGLLVCLLARFACMLAGTVGAHAPT